MKKISLILLAACFGILGAHAAKIVRVTVENSSASAQSNVPVVVSVSKLRYKKRNKNRIGGCRHCQKANPISAR